MLVCPGKECDCSGMRQGQRICGEINGIVENDDLLCASAYMGH